MLLIKHGFLFDIGVTIWRVLGGFVLAAMIAVPFGVLMGAYKPVEAFLSRSSPLRAICRPRPSFPC